ncbi:leucine-rich repeat-containing protein (LRR) [Tieghemostelium lacteum]|uniref:Leucine-rich repeat-containing protein (LRR) n=1 Tax=Tieghemostelium lacteum TaxID=361077 RepID=A0A152A199_TIELA|nr:leucine-rich repeat-containing protein (LRR) [Tieghemostelium lacteum]|eukprot:KYQ99854.1 leucine-rich repeat-containing protein (LRR) [Tieghemostelium lacteum]
MGKNDKEEVIPERLDLAYRDITEINPRIVERFGPYTKELDLSNNNLEGDLLVLEGFPLLTTLVLDNNKLTSHCKFANLPKLHTLWINSNSINNLSVFIDKLLVAFPNLKVLSMLKNEACPNFFNGHSLKEYKDYRMYVISKLKNLHTLDVTPVTTEERIDASKVYGNNEGSTLLSKTVVTIPTQIKPGADEFKEDDPKLKRQELERKQKEDQIKKRQDRKERKAKRAQKLEEKAEKKLQKDLQKQEVLQKEKEEKKKQEDEFTDSEEETEKIKTQSTKLPVFSSDQAPLLIGTPPIPSKTVFETDYADDEAMTNNTQDSDTDKDLPTHKLAGLVLPHPNILGKPKHDDDDDTEEEEDTTDDDLSDEEKDDDDETEDDETSDWSSDEDMIEDNTIPSKLQLPKKYNDDDDDESEDESEDDDDD